MTPLLELLENRLSYGILFSITYLIFLSHLISVDTSKEFFIPHPLVLLFVLFCGFILMFSMQEVDHKDVKFKQIILWHLLALIPTNLIIYHSRKIIKSLKKKNDDIMIILGWYIFNLINWFLSILLLSTIVLVLILNQNLLILLLLFYATIGISGISVGYLLSKIRLDPNQKLQTFQSNVLSPLLGSSKKRVIMTLFIIIIDLVIAFYQVVEGISPIIL